MHVNFEATLRYALRWIASLLAVLLLPVLAQAAEPVVLRVGDITYDNRPTPGLVQLYRRWASSGLGLIITGSNAYSAWRSPGNLVWPMACRPRLI